MILLSIFLAMPSILSIHYTSMNIKNKYQLFMTLLKVMTLIIIGIH